MKPGDIVLIQFPQTDLTIGKLRPALLIAQTPGHHGDVLLALITSQMSQAVSGFDEKIDAADPDFATTGLKVSSVVRLARLTCVDPAIISARLGNLSVTRLQQIRKRMADWLVKG